ncbi:hypothetical protein FJM09_05195 [Clostridium perfringens]|uniref:DUF3784 domain-containing protein n=1 Tax=Clostridium perfringens TaxID=1502 RepID=A0A133N099_CLOPF|nr:hypothetical protein BXT91_05540 [Clostridium perfringens]ATD49063.1 hypothetical protein CMR01_09805 [Clostridium perfringens]EGT3600297.1 hypothetical protein [Clostridium perfringens]KXA09633.1 hypothetical protein HMPREF3222_02271 [Clostridium perfringens]PWW83529.1 hypothetical protein CYK81_15430 [Clostridium perfringens]
MLIYYCISLMILLTMLMTGIVNPICSFFNGDTEIRFNGILYTNLNEEKYKKILFSTFLNFIILILCLFIVCFKFNTFFPMFLAILCIIFLQYYILKPLK